MLFPTTISIWIYVFLYIQINLRELRRYDIKPSIFSKQISTDCSLALLKTFRIMGVHNKAKMYKVVFRHLNAETFHNIERNIVSLSRK